MRALNWSCASCVQVSTRRTRVGERNDVDAAGIQDAVPVRKGQEEGRDITVNQSAQIYLESGRDYLDAAVDVLDGELGALG
jgi:hypothetical protein